MGPASGVYYIHNIGSKYYLADQPEPKTGEVVPVSKTTPAKFIVSESGGLYSITLLSGDGLSVGITVPSVVGDSLKWQRNPYQWNIIPLTAGVWNIRVPAEPLYWFDTVTRPANVIVQRDNTRDENNWQFIAA